MARRTNTVIDSIMEFAAVIGGAYLGVELLKLFAKRIKVYSCPICNQDVEFNTPICPNCKTHLLWNQPDSQ